MICHPILLFGTIRLLGTQEYRGNPAIHTPPIVVIRPDPHTSNHGNPARYKHTPPIVVIRPDPHTTNSVLTRLLLQGAAPCPLFVTPCPFEKDEMTPCPFFKKYQSHMAFSLLCPFCCPHTAWIVMCIFY